MRISLILFICTYVSWIGTCSAQESKPLKLLQDLSPEDSVEITIWAGQKQVAEDIDVCVYRLGIPVEKTRYDMHVFDMTHGFRSKFSRYRDSTLIIDELKEVEKFCLQHTMTRDQADSLDEAISNFWYADIDITIDEETASYILELTKWHELLRSLHAIEARQLLIPEE